jgi:hypothetical protein
MKLTTKHIERLKSLILRSGYCNELECDSASCPWYWYNDSPICMSNEEILMLSKRRLKLYLLNKEFE